jgi:hypothetical protein
MVPEIMLAAVVPMGPAGEFGAVLRTTRLKSLNVSPPLILCTTSIQNDGVATPLTVRLYIPAYTLSLLTDMTSLGETLSSVTIAACDALAHSAEAKHAPMYSLFMLSFLVSPNEDLFGLTSQPQIILVTALFFL